MFSAGREEPAALSSLSEPLVARPM